MSWDGELGTSPGFPSLVCVILVPRNAGTVHPAARTYITRRPRVRMLSPSGSSSSGRKASPLPWSRSG